MVDDATQYRLDSIVRARIAKKQDEIEHSLRQIAAGNPLGSETNERRMVARLAMKTGFDTRRAEALSASIQQTASAINSPAARQAEALMALEAVVPTPVRMTLALGRPEAVWGTADFVGVEFFARGRRAANSVGRVLFQNGRAQGTGFIVAPGLLLTNNHVMQTAAAAESMCVQFDFEVDERGFDRSSTVYGFDVAKCFAFSPIEDLDFTLIAIGDRIEGSKALDGLGYVPLSDAGDKHMLGELANIIQHPEGRPKQIVLRENNLVARDETVHVLHYLADTQPGSSGSPVFNNEWEAIALHHWASPHLETTSVDGRQLRVDVNEGVRISAIVKMLRRLDGARDARTRESIAEAIQLWDRSRRNGPVEARGANERADGATLSRARTNADGSISWIFPIEINVRGPMSAPPVATAAAAPPAPAVAAERGRVRDEDFSDRGGYESGFIPGFHVPLPDFSGVGYRIARNQQSTADDDKFELRYHHFSAVINAERRLAAFTACNIDGARIKAIDRKTKTVTDDPTLRQLDVESLGPESSDAFRPDARVLPEEQMTREFYDEQKVPGFDKPTFPGSNASD